MTVVPLIGNALITFGPSGAIFVLYVYQTPQLVLICIASMVFYMLSIFTVSVASLVPLPHDLRRISYVVLGVVAHECWRLLYVFVYRRVHDGFQHRGKRFRLLVSRFGLLPAAIGTCSDGTMEQHFSPSTVLRIIICVMILKCTCLHSSIFQWYMFTSIYFSMVYVYIHLFFNGACSCTFIC